MKTKEEYIEGLRAMIAEDDGLKSGNSDEIIYQIDGMNVYGDYEEGIRGVDHNVLMFPDVEWEDIIRWGTLVIPESKTYVSEDEITYFENRGYQRINPD